MSDTWTIEGREFSSRLLLGTAMYPSREVMLDALKASGTQVATVALRRVKPDTDKDVNLY